MDDMMMAEDWADPDRDERMPLVFLNACGTSVVDPRTAVSMMTPFLKNANRGIIATSANIPDRVAARFSRWFYTKLLSGLTVAEALYAARRDLLVTYANPLGVLYAYYGNPGLRVHSLSH
jgi:CHAT domain-containing protein